MTSTSESNSGMVDTSVLVSFESGREVDTGSLPESLFVSIITIGELRAGVLNAPNPSARAVRLETFMAAVEMGPLPVDMSVASSWSLLRGLLDSTGQRMGVNDSWIAATAMAHDMPVVTQDQGFPELDGLAVIRV